MKERLYDRVSAGLDRAGFGERRERLARPPARGHPPPPPRRARRVVALEPDVRYARRLRERASEAAVDVEVVEGTAESLPFDDRSFDEVVTTLALCSIADLGAALGEVRRVLRSGGGLQFIEHVRGDGRLRRWQDRLT